MTVEKKLKKIAEQWFYSEPVLFSTFCTHSLVENSGMSVPVRTGQMRIEFSSLLLEKCTDSQLEEYLKIEIYRILLQHPYMRQPHNAKKGILLLASDVTINQFYKPSVSLAGIEYFKQQAVRFRMLEHPLGIKWHCSPEEKFFQKNLNINKDNGNLETLDDLSFDEWYRWILFLVRETSFAGENAGSANGDDSRLSQASNEISELWEENQEAQAAIQNEIQKAETDQGWGGLGGNLQRKVKQGADLDMDYRRILSQFRTNILSADRTLTRMRPNRRFGFKAMGCRYERKANILVAVDVSGSISDESFSNFLHAINNFFIFGIEKLDLIFFDTNLKNSKPVTIKKKIELKDIKGRGGTNFQPAIDFYFEHKEYNGMIIFTDGEGNIPLIKKQKSNILWILSSRLDYEKAKQWIGSLSGNKCTYLPV